MSSPPRKKLGLEPNYTPPPPPAVPPGCWILSTVPIYPQRFPLTLPPSFPPMLPIIGNLDEYEVYSPVDMIYYRPPPVEFQSNLPPGLFKFLQKDGLPDQDMELPPGMPPGLFKFHSKDGYHLAFKRIPF
jgi:hypothetical protein